MPTLKFTLFLLAVTSSFACQNSVACPPAGAFNSAYNQKNITSLRKFSNNLSSCAEITKDKYRYLIARRLYDQLFKDKPEEKITAQDYDEILRIQPNLWAALADLGDLSMKARSYKAGLQFYEQAIVDIKGLPQEILAIKADKDAIPHKYILTLKDKADNARLLASLSGHYIKPLRTTRGKLDGMHSFAIRGAEVSLHKYPIRFAYDRHQLQKKKNSESLALLYEVLHDAGDPDIEMIGHTDTKGGHAYNDRLSLQRANSIRDYLLNKKHYKGTINAIGKGEREPIQMHSARRNDLTDKQWRQLNRRVETKRVTP